MRRIILLVTVALLMATILVVGPAPASAEAGCQDFGLLAASEAQQETGIGEEVSAAVPADDDVIVLKGLAGC
jgi:hypothetical protein